jgi:hypothetical protein
VILRSRAASDALKSSAAISTPRGFVESKLTAECRQLLFNLRQGGDGSRSASASRASASWEIETRSI